ncbi:RNA polymerase sigma factor [bacterium]|nr:RNA polymerase sigma factor [bacterium]
MVQIPSGVILACVDRDDRAWRELIRLTSAPLNNLARKYLGNPDWAEDVLQEAYIKIYRNLGSLRDASRAYSWMCSIVVNECRQMWHRQKKHQGSDIEDIEYKLGGEREHDCEMDEREMTELMDKALKAMPSKLREVLILREFQELEYDEIAKVAGIPIGTVRSRLARAREKLAEMLRELMGGKDIVGLVGAHD